MEQGSERRPLSENSDDEGPEWDDDDDEVSCKCSSCAVTRCATGKQHFVSGSHAARVVSDSSQMEAPSSAPSE